jgi:hypothetical protein
MSAPAPAGVSFNPFPVDVQRRVDLRVSHPTPSTGSLPPCCDVQDALATLGGAAVLIPLARSARQRLSMASCHGARPCQSCVQRARGSLARESTGRSVRQASHRNRAKPPARKPQRRNASNLASPNRDSPCRRAGARSRGRFEARSADARQLTVEASGIEPPSRGFVHTGDACTRVRRDHPAPPGRGFQLRAPGYPVRQRTTTVPTIPG